MTRPKSVRLFERLWIVSTILGVLDILLHHDKPYALAMFLALSGVVWFFIVRRPSNIARWILALALGTGMFRMPEIFAEVRLIGTGAILMSLGTAVLRIVGTALLFRKDAADWFRRKGKVADQRGSSS